jgi:hypothetical protein
MSAKSVARLLWLAPILLALLAIYQGYVAWNVHRVLSQGLITTASISNNQIKRPPGLNHLKLTLEVNLPNGQVMTKKMTLPEEEEYHLGGKDGLKDGTLKVQYLPDNPQDLILIDKDKNGFSIAERQRNTSLINLATLVLFIGMIGIPIGLWNRYLTKNGDPAYRTV